MNCDNFESKTSPSAPQNLCESIEWTTAATGDDGNGAELLTRSLFLNKIITDMIFQSLPLSDLLELSKASKWMLYEVRNYIRSQRCSIECSAFVCRRGRRDDLAKFDQFLATAAVRNASTWPALPFNGLQIKVHPCFTRRSLVGRRGVNLHECGIRAIDELYPRILNYHPIRYLSFDSKDEGNPVPCPAFALFQKLVQTHANELVQVALLNVPKLEVCRRDGPSVSMPKLRSFNLGVSLDGYVCLNLSPFLARLFYDAPNLSDISMYLFDVAKILSSRRRFVRTLYIQCKHDQDGITLSSMNKFFSSWERLAAATSPSPGTYHVGVSRFVVKQYMFEPENTFPDPLLHMLERWTGRPIELSILDPNFWIPERFPALPHLKNLEVVDRKVHVFREAIASAIALKFQQLESLTLAQYGRVALYASGKKALDRRRRSDTYWLLFIRRNPRQPLPSLTNLTLQLDFSLMSVHLFEEFAPNVRTLELIPIQSSSSNPEDSAGWLFQNVWKLWPLLEELKLQEEPNTKAQLDDAIMCGIHPEEVEYLSTCADEFLQSVHIVPIQPALTTMQRLKNLEITLLLGNSDRDGIQNGCLLSRVTSNCVFSRMRPQLSVTMSPFPRYPKAISALKKMFPGVSIKDNYPPLNHRLATRLDMPRK